VFAYLRALEGDELLVVANLSDDTARPHLPDGWEDAEIVISNLDEARRPGETWRAWEATVFRRRDAHPAG
jgi:hypothetical protein